MVGKALNLSPAGTSVPKLCVRKYPRINVDLGCQGYCKPVFDRHQFETFWELRIKKHSAARPPAIGRGPCFKIISIYRYPLQHAPRLRLRRHHPTLRQMRLRRLQRRQNRHAVRDNKLEMINFDSKPKNPHIRIVQNRPIFMKHKK